MGTYIFAEAMIERNKAVVVVYLSERLLSSSGEPCELLCWCAVPIPSPDILRSAMISEMAVRSL